MSELLLELYAEEIPALMQEKARSSYHEIFEKKLKEAGIDSFNIVSNVGPRRISFFLTNLPKSLESKKTELKGPKVGAPDPAIEGFCKSNNISRKDLVIKEVKGQECYFLLKESGKREMTQILPKIITETIGDYVWPKSMCWGDYEMRFVRPLLNILCLFDGKLLDLEYGHLKSSDYTFGHRFTKYEKIRVGNIDDYKNALKASHVILSREERLEIIKSEVLKIEKEHKVTVDMPPKLLEEVAGLNEHVRVLIGKISDKFMHLPSEILTTSMRSHQRFFSCSDGKGGFAPYFVFVSNVVDADAKEIVSGNEKVLSARLADALYFYEQDQKTDLSTRVNDLGKLVFHEKLGSMKDKVKRLEKLSAFVKPGDKDLEKAAMFCKSDLTTEMVGEFPELQGVMGCYYAKLEGLNDRVANYIGNHYKPVGLSDMPDKDAMELALIDKVDSLTSLMIAGERATGSKDPYALRRYALGIIRIILEGIDINLVEMVEHSAGTLKEWSESCISDIIQFIEDRLKNYWKDQYRHDLINAVVDFDKEDNLLLVKKKIDALQNFVSKNEANDLLSIYLRISNIIGDNLLTKVQENLLKASEEKALYNKYLEVEPVAIKLMENCEYGKVFDLILSLKDPLTNFFDNVLVNDDDLAIAANRKALLGNIYNLFQGIANFNHLSNL